MAGSVIADMDVKIILEKYSKGLTKSFDCLVSHLSQPDIESTDLVRYLRGLKDCISLLNKDFEILVDVVLKVNWSVREEFVVKEYQSYLLNLVSAHTYYLRACLHMLVKNFYPKQHVLPREYVKDNRTPVDEAMRTYHDLSFSNVHIVTKNLCEIAPSASATLVSLIDECFPYYTRCIFTQECYVKNLLAVTHYLSHERLHLLNLLIDRMLQIDVRCSREEIHESEEREDTDMEGELFDMEGDQKDEVVKCMQHKEANKLDVMMYYIFLYTHNVCHQGGELDWEKTKKLYREMLCIFEKVVLPTYASCHVQFIMFYLCSLREALCEGYLDFLWKYVQNPNSESVHRQSAVSYIASLIGRASYISVSTVKTIVELMCAWVHKYIDKASHSTQPDVWRHGPFYSVCQAVFYIIIFRHKHILETKGGYKWVEGLGLQTIVTSRLNPLKVCLPVVTRTFSNIARIHQLAFCDAIIERNNRSVLPIASGYNSALTHVNKLDAFFPFDPYLLSRSGEYVWGLYREFEGVVHDEVTQDIEEEDEFLDDVKHEKNVLCHSRNASPLDFMDYGISPGFKNI